MGIAQRLISLWESEVHCPSCGGKDLMFETGYGYCCSCTRIFHPPFHNKWDLRFLELAKLVSTWSKDPSTQTGACIVDQDRRVVSVGYNGFAKGVQDHPERYADRDLKYKLIVHCERNAILFAKRDLTGCTLYTYPFMSCSVCAGMVIQSGITRCVAPKIPDDKKERWAEDMALSEQIFREAGVEVCLL